MAHFAQLNEFNIVQRVIVVSNSECLDTNGNESEAVGAAFCHNLLGGRWIQTSYNNNIRVRYAGIGYKYDQSLDAFITPQPYPSWVLSPLTIDWEAPVPMPTNGGKYTWNETTQSWDEVNEN